MSTDQGFAAGMRLRSRKGAVALLAAGAVAGGVLAGTLTASAAGSGSTGSTGSAPSAGMPAYPPPMANGSVPANRFGSKPMRHDETTPGASIVATLTSKAEAQVSGGTVYRVETDAGDAAYEAHMKKADGTLVTVKFDKSLNVTKVETGMGQGDPGPGGMHMGPPPPGTPPGSGQSSTQSG